MKTRIPWFFRCVALVLGACIPFAFPAQNVGPEPHLANLRQLTDGGQNAEAYWSPDGQKLIYQGFTAPGGCDQIFTMNADGSGKRLVSTGKGRCTCAYFTKDGRRIFFSSTHAAAPGCPPKPDMSQGYVWPVYDTYKIYIGDADDKHLKCLTPWRAYNAEGTLSPDGSTILFTSDRDGDLELYTMDLEGKHLKRLTSLPGYDGGAFFSPDGTKICFRGWHPTGKELGEYQVLLKRHLVRPTHMELFVMNADGTGMRQVTSNGAANFCPYFTPDGKRLIFASNLGDPQGRNFDLYLIGLDGTGLERVTTNPTFDGFPMFSPDGKRLAFASNRNAKVEHETNIFVADWVENPPKPAPEALAIDANTVKRDVYFLASPELKGRLSGTPEGRKAAEYVASQFKEAGLQTVPGMTSYFQPFEFTARVTLAPGNALSAVSGGTRKTYFVEKDFQPMGFSDDADLKGLPVVFAGYGIKAPDLQHDDYAGLDVKGKAVFIYRYGPEGDDPKSKYALYYPLRYKAMIAREAGAAALVVLSPDAQDDEISTLKVDRGFGASGLPVLGARREVLGAWLAAAGRVLPDPKIPHGVPLTFEVPGLTLDLAVRLNRERATADNVLAWLPASRATEETLVVGAHYDHLGTGIEGSLASAPGQIHPGADDNASGTAGIMGLARAFSRVPERGRNLLFVSFGGEELGTLGSGYFVKNPPLPLKSDVAMFNLDMVGRLREGKLTVGGAGTSPDWKPLLEACNTEGLKLTLNEDGYGASDHSQFYAKGVPVLFFFTGSHAEYHRPEDKPETLDYPAEAEVLRYVSRLAKGVLAAAAAPPYAVTKSGGKEGAGRGFRVYLGTIPDYNEEVKGVRLMGVRAGGPAERAGLKGGDTIVRLGDKKIENVYDYTYALQEHKAGETVSIVVLRDGKEVTFAVTFEKRASE